MQGDQVLGPRGDARGAEDVGYFVGLGKELALCRVGLIPFHSGRRREGSLLL